MGDFWHRWKAIQTQAMAAGLRVMLWHPEHRRLTVVNQNGPTTVLVSARAAQILNEAWVDSLSMTPDERRK